MIMSAAYSVGLLENVATDYFFGALFFGGKIMLLVEKYG